MLPKADVFSKPVTDILLTVDKVIVPRADVAAIPVTDMLFTDVVVAVPRFAAANTQEGVTFASA